MDTMDIVVYREYRKYGRLPAYAHASDRPIKTLQQVPILLVSADLMEQAITLQDVDIIDRHHHHFIILTDKRRVLVVHSSGYSYARYVYSIDETTAQTILSQV